MFRLTLLFVCIAGFIPLRHRWPSLDLNSHSVPKLFRQGPVNTSAFYTLSGLQAVLFPAQAAGKKQNQKDKQNESKPTSAYHRSAQVKPATTEQQHQYD